VSLFTAVYGVQLAVAGLALWSIVRGVRTWFVSGPLPPERLDDVQLQTSACIDRLRALARMAPPLAFGSAIAVMATGFGGDAGLVALQRGLAESIALSRAMLSVVTGMTTSLVCRAAANALVRRARALLSEER
jgi:hypothetical protein